MSVEERLSDLKTEVGTVKESGHLTHVGVVALQAKMEVMVASMSKIEEVLITGNGRPPLTVEMARLDEKVTEIRQDVGQQQADLDGRCGKCAVARVESRKIRWAAVAAIGGSVAGVASLITVLFVFL